MKNQRKEVAIVLSFLFLLLTGTAAGQTSPPAQVSPLEPLARLAGGEWLGQFKMPNGTTSDVRNVFEWGLNGKILKARYFSVSGGVGQLVYEGVFAWHPAEKKIIFQEHSASGSLVEGSVEPVENGLVFDWTQYAGSKVTHYREAFRFPDNDHYLSQAYEKTESGAEKLVVEGAFHRVATAATGPAAPTWERALRKEVTVAAPATEIGRAHV